MFQEYNYSYCLNPEIIMIRLSGFSSPSESNLWITNSLLILNFVLAPQVVNFGLVDNYLQFESIMRVKCKLILILIEDFR